MIIYNNNTYTCVYTWILISSFLVFFPLHPHLPIWCAAWFENKCVIHVSSSVHFSRRLMADALWSEYFTTLYSGIIPMYEDLDASGKCRKLHGKNMYTLRDRGHKGINILFNEFLLRRRWTLGIWNKIITIMIIWRLIY